MLEFFQENENLILILGIVSAISFLGTLAFLVKNIVGVIIVLLGIAMLVLPGQGLLMILIGLALVVFPGKYKLERWLISREPVYKSANWLREKANKEPLVIE